MFDPTVDLILLLQIYKSLQHVKWQCGSYYLNVNQMVFIFFTSENVLFPNLPNQKY